MGLDISAYKGPVKLVVTEAAFKGLSDEEKDHYYDTGGHVYAAHPSLAERLGSLEPGFYEFAARSHFRAGSYSAYNYWRDWLAKAALYAPAAVVWENPEKFRDKPFYELINFSDCEGAFGPEACARLAKAFADNRERIFKDFQTEDSWFMDLYNDFASAFAEAAETGGFVRFS